MVIAAGFGLLLLCAAIGRLIGGPIGVSRAALVFLPLWLLGAGVNMYIGVAGAGYSVADELPIFLLVSTVPAIAALFLWRKRRVTVPRP